jgi:tetratricopeptide (TPR) repeat protein
MALAFLQQELTGVGSLREAEEADHQALEIVEKLVTDYPDEPYYRELLGWTLDLLGWGRQGRGQLQQEEQAWRQELDAYAKLAQAVPSMPRYRNQVLWTQQILADLLCSTGRQAEAAQLFQQIMEWLDRLSPEDAGGHDIRAWFLATCSDPRYRNPRRAVDLARRATALAPKERGYWMTLGAASYRAGNWQQAVEAFAEAHQQPEVSTASFFFLAMAHAQLGHKDQAHQCYQRAVQLMVEHEPHNRELSRFRAEAEQVLGIGKAAR